MPLRPGGCWLPCANYVARFELRCAEGESARTENAQHAARATAWHPSALGSLPCIELLLSQLCVNSITWDRVRLSRGKNGSSYVAFLTLWSVRTRLCTRNSLCSETGQGFGGSCPLQPGTAAGAPLLAAGASAGACQGAVLRAVKGAGPVQASLAGAARLRPGKAQGCARSLLRAHRPTGK